VFRGGAAVTQVRGQEDGPGHVQELQAAGRHLGQLQQCCLKRFLKLAPGKKARPGGRGCVRTGRMRAGWSVLGAALPEDAKRSQQLGCGSLSSRPLSSRAATPPANRYFLLQCTGCLVASAVHAVTAMTAWCSRHRLLRGLNCFCRPLHLHNTYLHVDQDAPDAASCVCGRRWAAGSAPAPAVPAVMPLPGQPAIGRRPGPRGVWGSSWCQFVPVGS
jgi:hypothetical protein